MESLIFMETVPSPSAIEMRSGGWTGIKTY
jgi:hypothetical protein